LVRNLRLEQFVIMWLPKREIAKDVASSIRSVFCGLRRSSSLDTAVVYKSLLVVDKQTEGFAGALRRKLKEKKGDTTAMR